ncbi:hypothetical protein KI387_023174, partial [Taxus chinensis]
NRVVPVLVTLDLGTQVVNLLKDFTYGIEHEYILFSDHYSSGQSRLTKNVMLILYSSIPVSVCLVLKAAMASSKSSIACIVMVGLCWSAVNAQLSISFYRNTCPSVSTIVNAMIKQVVTNQPRMGASLLRLHFHDCFVNGCDGSVLLDDTPNFTGEKTAAPNANSLRGFDVIDNIKAQVGRACRGVLGGPAWPVTLGRRDSRTASLSGANSNLPAPSSNLTALISAFGAQGLSPRDMVALSGAHTIGQARCITFRGRAYNESNIDTAFAASLRAKCPSRTGAGDNNLSPLDVATPNFFDNNYYKNLISQKGLLHSDQVLFNGGSSNAQVTSYTTNQNGFFNDFSAAM